MYVCPEDDRVSLRELCVGAGVLSIAMRQFIKHDEKGKQQKLIIYELPAPQNCQDFLSQHKLPSSCRLDRMDTFRLPFQCRVGAPILVSALSLSAKILKLVEVLVGAN